MKIEKKKKNFNRSILLDFFYSTENPKKQTVDWRTIIFWKCLVKFYENVCNAICFE